MAPSTGLAQFPVTMSLQPPQSDGLPVTAPLPGLLLRSQLARFYDLAHPRNICKNISSLDTVIKTLQGLSVISFG